MSREDDGATLLHMDELKEEADQAASESVGVEMTVVRPNATETKDSTASRMEEDDGPPDTEESIRQRALYLADRVKKFQHYDINDTAKAQLLLKNQGLLGGGTSLPPGCPTEDNLETSGDFYFDYEVMRHGELIKNSDDDSASPNNLMPGEIIKVNDGDFPVDCIFLNKIFETEGEDDHYNPTFLSTTHYDGAVYPKKYWRGKPPIVLNQDTNEAEDPRPELKPESYHEDEIKAMKQADLVMAGLKTEQQYAALRGEVRVMPVNQVDDLKFVDAELSLEQTDGLTEPVNFRVTFRHDFIPRGAKVTANGCWAVVAYQKSKGKLLSEQQKHWMQDFRDNIAQTMENKRLGHQPIANEDWKEDSVKVTPSTGGQLKGDDTGTTIGTGTGKKQQAQNNLFYFISLAMLALCVIAAVVLAIVFGVISDSGSTAAPASSVPSTPALLAGTVGHRSVVLTYQSSSSDGNSPVTQYNVEATYTGGTALSVSVAADETCTGGATCSSALITVSGLTNGVAYSFTISATNLVGTSAVSASLGPFTPSDPTRTALGNIYTALNGPWYVTQTDGSCASASGWDASDIDGSWYCGWSGISCTNSQGTSLTDSERATIEAMTDTTEKNAAMDNVTVTGLNLAEYYADNTCNINTPLTGTLPGDIGSLTDLTEINFAADKITGMLPSEIGGLTNLVTLNLQRNCFTNELPGEMIQMTALRNLDLSGQTSINGHGCGTNGFIGFNMDGDLQGQWSNFWSQVRAYDATTNSYGTCQLGFNTWVDSTRTCSDYPDSFKACTGSGSSGNDPATCPS